MIFERGLAGQRVLDRLAAFVVRVGRLGRPASCWSNSPGTRANRAYRSDRTAHLNGGVGRLAAGDRRPLRWRRWHPIRWDGSSAGAGRGSRSSCSSPSGDGVTPHRDRYCFRERFRRGSGRAAPASGSARVRLWTTASSSGSESCRILIACCSCGVITSCWRSRRSCPSFTSRAIQLNVNVTGESGESTLSVLLRLTREDHPRWDHQRRSCRCSDRP